MIRINDFQFKATLKAAVIVGGFLLFAAAMAFGQQQINLTAAPTTTTLPDGTAMPMWGYFCGTAVTGSTATCAALNPNSAATLTTPATWSPMVITVPAGQGLTINLTNNLSFIPTGSTTANTIPTSIVIVGQVGGGLGNVLQRTTTPSPNHADAQGCQTWFIANTPPGQPCTTSAPLASPPNQGPRVQSFGTEVAGGAATATALTWSALKPGTYLLESGTHPSIQVPMGLIGMLVVTTAPSGTTPGTAYPAVGTVPAVQYNAELPLLFSEIDPVQNKTVDQAVRTVGFSETAVWTRMNAFGPVTALTLTNPGSGYTSAPIVTIAPPTTAGSSIGTTATATATLASVIGGIAITSGGTGYAIGDALTFTGGGGTGAAGTVSTIGAGGVITGITLSSGGTGYTSSPTVGVTSLAGTGAVLAATFSVSAITITNGGDGYMAAPIVTVAAPTTTGLTATATAALTLGGCGGAHTCYPPAVNYTPFYYLINGVAFSKNTPAFSLFPATAGVSSTTGLPVTTNITGTVLVRMVNAGLRMHVPSIVGSQTQGFNGAGAAAMVSGFTLIAEDGNVIPGVAVTGSATTPAAPRVQTDVFMAASKTFDVMINVPATPTGATAPPSLPVYDRELSLSGNSSVRDAGMLAYIGVNGAGLPVTVGTGIFATPQANNDTYNSLVPGLPLTVSDPSKGVIANDINVYGVTLLAPPTHGTVTCTLLGTVPGLCANGTFTFTPDTTNPASDSFTYCANNGFIAATTTTPASCASANLIATVTLGPSVLLGKKPVVSNITYTAQTATFLKIPSPGVLSVDSDPDSLPLTVVTSGTNAPTLTGGTLLIDPNGGFTASVSGTGTAACPIAAPAGSNCWAFNYYAQNSLGVQSASSATVTLVFPPPSNLIVNVLDGAAYANCNGDSTCLSGLAPITDYRWIIEEDKTFWVDPNCTANSSINTPGCPGTVGTGGTVPNFSVNFHTSNMGYVAQGCTGPLSCEGGQTIYDNRQTIPNPLAGQPGQPATIPNPTYGQHIFAICDVGNGACRPDPNQTTGSGFTPVMPGSVHLDPSKRYYISVLPGDAANPFPSYVGQPGCNPATGAQTGPGNCGHTMSGAPIPPACNVLGGPNGCTASSAFVNPVTVLALPTPLPTGKLSVVVFEDDFPLNGEQDTGGGVDVVSPQEPGLGGFNLVLWDTYGTLGDVTGQDTYDMFNQPLANALAGMIDPATGLDACPTSPESRIGMIPNPLAGQPGQPAMIPDPTQTGITGTIVTCPKYESDGKTVSPLAGQALVVNLMPDKFSVQAYPGADRIARGEEWIQTNTLDGQHPHDSFIRIGEPGYFQEYGPAGYHVSIGFANPKIINARHDAVCNGLYGPVGPCNNTIEGEVDVQRLSRTPDQRLYPSGSHDALSWTQCWVSLGDPDAEDFMFTKCDANGNFKFTNVPGGNWRLTLGDQWNDQIIDGLSTPANVGCILTPPATTCPPGTVTDLKMGHIGVQQWQSNVYTRTYVDDNKDGIWEPNELGIPLLNTAVRYRDGHIANNLLTDFNGIANFNETFPLFNWYVVEADTTRYKTTGIHTVYDAGGPSDGSPDCGNGTNGARPCGLSPAYNFVTNTFEAVPLPADLSVPGAVYCLHADCTAEAATFALGGAIPSYTAAAGTGSAQGLSTGRIDPPWVMAEGWSGETSQGNYVDFGKAPYAACPPACATVTVTAPGSTTPTSTQVAENGGVHGHVVYVSTRPFDDASLLVQEPWEPLVPHVTINLYQEGFAADGVTPTLTLVDSTQTSSWDDWAQGFYPNYTDPVTGTALPYMSCPGQGTAAASTPNQDLFFFTLYNQPNYLDLYNSEHNGGTLHPLPYNSQFKCYDAMHIWNQVQPAPYDGMYSFPSSLGINPTTGKLLTTTSTGAALYGSTNGVKSSMAGTNCTICVPNPDATDLYRVGNPMLPPGKYVVEVVMPPGFEVEKEEDKNLLIGDNYIAPTTQEFGGLGGYIFILPDQASVASLYDPSGSGYNPNNFQNSTQSMGAGQQSQIVPGLLEPVWPCVGEQRVVPDYLSLFPQVHEVAPFAGATRPLCDRKEVTLASQMGATAKFYIYTSTHIAAKFTGVITDDFTSEFDPFAPTFGEKFSPPNMPISTRDYLGNEVSRVYSDHFGIFDGLTYSSWEVNPPNITGYSPIMMVQCMNDAGPIPDGKGGWVTDPLYNPAYSDFCYELPYMPGLTSYLDTPVVPTQAFVGAGYNNADCAYPDATPAVSEVDGDGIGPWVSATGPRTLTITALGDQMVPNDAYSGPSATVAPFNQKTVKRHFGFGTRCVAPVSTSQTCNTRSSVTIGGVSAPITGWSDTSITVIVPPSVPACTIQQQAQYGGSATQCGQLVITAGNGRQSIDTVTVTAGGKTPTHVAASATIQGAIDAAAPGDLIIVDPTCSTGTTVVPCTTAGANKAPASHTEMLIMWKPVRLQGVGAASTIINANTHPAGKLLDPWRRHINCLFGLTLQGVPYGNTTPYDSTTTYSCPEQGWAYYVATGQTVNASGVVTAGSSPQIDRLPLEATVGWDATLNGNLAELLQEPSLMGAYEGAGITVLAKGLDFHGQSPWSDGTEAGAFPTVTTLLTGVVSNPGAAPGTPGGLLVGDANPLCHTSATVTTNPFPSNYICNPASIDGLTVTNSSQGGGGIFIHGWAHLLQIANNRVYNNAGTLSGGISVGQGEFATPYIKGGATNAAPGSCSDGTGLVNNQHEPMCLQSHVNVHHNMITDNSSIGDELFSATLSGGGGATVCTGNDYYLFNYNWICGNISAGEGGGMVHLGEIFNGDIEHNSIVFNQSSNPTIPTNGGGIMVQGTPDTDPICPGVPDSDCPPGLSDGTGPGLVINANLIQGNSADSGAGGGIRVQGVNGTEVGTFASQPQYWHDVTITNNIIVNNMAGWDGAGISLQDALKVNITNNTIAANDTLASSGVLINSIGAPSASAPPGECHNAAGTASCPQPAGLASTPNSLLLTQSFAGLTVTCPPGHSGCTGYSNPILANDLFWQNGSFYIGVGNRGSGNLNQQVLVSLYEAFTNTLAPTQAATGACSAISYWDIGVRGDRTLTGHESGFTLSPTWSVLTDATDYPGGNNLGSNPTVVSQYCNGSRVPPECTANDGCAGLNGFGVPPGIADSVTPNPVFSLVPSATVDEGNNWINVSWGPLSLSNPSVTGGAYGNYGGGSPLGNYVLAAGSPAIDYVPATQPAPSTDFFGNPRPDPSVPGCYDVGAVEYQGRSGSSAGCGATPQLISISPNTGGRGTVVNVTLTGTNLTYVTAVNVSGTGIAVSNVVAVNATTVTATFTISSTAGLLPRSVTVTSPGGTSNAVTFTVTAGRLSFTSATNATLNASGTILNFGSPVPRVPVTSVVTITNTGAAPLQITAETVTNVIGSNFSLTGTTCSFSTPLAVGGTCTVSIRYATPATRPLIPRAAVLSVANNGIVYPFPSLLGLVGQ